MKTFKFFWTTHKWTGIGLSLVFAMTAVTGFLLIVKKNFDWIQPPSQKGADGTLEDMRPLQEIIGAVLAQNHPDFQTLADIERIDIRPDKRIAKFRSQENWSEFQVDLMTGEVLSGRDIRRSDLIEQIHDGTFLGDWFHNWIMPVVAIALLFLVCSGLWLWLEPKVRKRKRKKRRQLRAVE